MKILQVDIVGTEKGVCASMGAPRSPKGGEERTGEKGRGRRRAARQRGTRGEGRGRGGGPRANDGKCENPFRENGAVVGGEGGSRDGLVRQTGRAVIWGQGMRGHGGRGAQRWGALWRRDNAKSGQEGADVAFTEVDTDATVPLSPPSVHHRVRPTTLFPP